MDGGHGVVGFAVDLAGQHVAGQALGNLFSGVQGCGALLQLHDRTVFQRDFYHRLHLVFLRKSLKHTKNRL